jgi:hypothetical protein
LAGLDGSGLKALVTLSESFEEAIREMESAGAAAAPRAPNLAA